MMTREHYARYCWLWQRYLRMTDGERNRLTPHLAHAWRHGFRQWPTVWPNVECAFGTVERFVEAMEAVIPHL